MVPGYVSCTTTCPEDSLPTGNFTWCINIASLDDDVETCIRLGEGQVPYTNSTCEAELVGIPNSLTLPSACPSIGEVGCLRLVYVDLFYENALLTCTLETENCTSTSFSTLLTTGINYRPHIENFTTSPVSVPYGGRLVLYAEVNDSFDYSVSIAWQHVDNVYSNFINEDPYCVTEIEQCTVDRHSVAARLKDKRIRAYRYPPWDVFDMCMYGTKSYLIVDNVTLNDDGEYLFSMAVVNNFIPSASDTTTSTIHVSIDYDLPTTTTDVSDSNSTAAGGGTPKSECRGSHCSSNGISPSAAGAIAVVTVVVVVTLSVLSVVFLYVRKKRKGLVFCP
jgi:hypothetical protein